MEKMRLETVQWHTLSNIDDVAPLNDADYDVLKEIGDVLRKYGHTARFGVCLLHKHFDLAEDEELVEKTDFHRRVSTTHVQPREMATGNSIETMWRYFDDLTVITKCVKRCVYIGGHTKPHVKEGW